MNFVHLGIAASLPRLARTPSTRRELEDLPPLSPDWVEAAAE
ncbi:hypothetical protein [Mesorhizobium sp.]|nr:hypothetical protein [Mesorhizobium sp.]